MASKPLRSQLNQVRSWVRQGRTDAWIAHQLEVSASELREFRRRHGLSAEDDAAEGDDLRDEIEAEVEAATAKAEAEAEAEAEAAAKAEAERAEAEDDGSGEDDGEAPKPRRRRRRRGGSGRPGVGMQASFDHGEDEGYGLWLDPAIADDPIYAEHWKGHSAVEVTVEPDRITIRRSE